MDAPAGPARATQHIVKVRREYNSWVAKETLEDFALRFTPRRFRMWSPWRVANTAFGAASFLVLEVVGATMMLEAGFLNAFWAILTTGLIIFMAGLPVSVYAARYGVDMDLLTRGAGFGYLGSTLTSLIYASFTFIFFALEAAIMAYALEMGLGIPPVVGYLLCALVVLPLVTHGVTVISRLQTWTQPIWALLLVLPYGFVLYRDPDAISRLWHFTGAGHIAGFDITAFGMALTVGVSMITQMGEQADYLRFMPVKQPNQSRTWWLAVLLGGPGWVVPGIAKMLGGALLAYLVLEKGVPAVKVVDPNQMYLLGFSTIFGQNALAVAATVLFVIISQLKINVTNAYAGSLAWSNFFSRLTHSHPGRVVWVVFNVLISLMLMELEVFQVIGRVLGLYSNIAISWFMVVVADLIINKPMGWSPAGIEFKRSHLYDINPVGMGAMLVASFLSISTFVGIWGAGLQPFAPFVAIVSALVVSPLLAWLTGGRYYLARGSQLAYRHLHHCVVCERQYETEDMAYCPAYQGPICSLCCSLDARCDDACKPQAKLAAQWTALLRRCLPAKVQPYLSHGLGHYLLLMSGVVVVLSLLLGLMYYLEIGVGSYATGLPSMALRDMLLRLFAVLLLLSAIVAWWMVLTQNSRQVAQEESNRQTGLLMQEIASHQETDAQLQLAKKLAEQANQAKSRYISSISHELRTPLNSILGYAQILEGDEIIPPSRRQAINVIRRSGDHLLAVIEGTMDIARIESGKLTLDIQPLDFHDFIEQIVSMVELQARNKGLAFRYVPQGELPAVVRADEKRLRQILLNLLGNAVKFTDAGEVVFMLKYQREMATFEVIDTGPGMAAEELERVFEPFERGRNARGGGSGLGLTISRMLATLMGGELAVSSQVGQGSTFSSRLFLPAVHNPAVVMAPKRVKRIGYEGGRRRILLVDNEKVDRDMLLNILAPLGFVLEEAASGHECLAKLAEFQPDLIFMDLAMPGMDGWETIRQIQAHQLSQAKVAIISANAFERGQDNDVNIRADDFIVKPIRVNDLLDWLGRALGLQWLTAEREMTTPIVVNKEWSMPPERWLTKLHDAVQLGYIKGMVQLLDAMEAESNEWPEFIRLAREHVRLFRLEALQALLKRNNEEPMA